MREKIMLSAITTYTQNLWERNDITLSEQEVKQILREVGLSTLDARKAANWEFVIALYEEAQKTTDIEVLKVALLNRLKERKYITEWVLLGLLKVRNLIKNYQLKVLHNYMHNTIEQEDRKLRRTDILNYTVELVTYYEASAENGVWTLELIKKEIQRILNTFYADLGCKEGDVEKAMGRRLIVRANTLKQFEAKHVQSHDVFGAYLKAYMPTQKGSSQQGEEELSVEDSLENLLNEMGLGEKNVSETVQDSGSEIKEIKEIEEKQVVESKENTSVMGCDTTLVKEEQEAVAQVIPEVGTQKKVENGVSNRVLGEAVEQKAFLQHMSDMARLLGYELHKTGDRIMSEEYYQALMLEKENAKADIWRNLAKVDRQSVLSELYNAYCQIQHISLANLEAVLGNFFTMLAMEGIEVAEELEVGEVLKVHTKDALKTFVFAEPTDQEGEVEAKLLYKAWKYKGKTMMPKVIKVKEEI